MAPAMSSQPGICSSIAAPPDIMAVSGAFAANPGQAYAATANCANSNTPTGTPSRAMDHTWASAGKKSGAANAAMR